MLPPLCSLLEFPLWILSSVSPGTVCILNPHPELELSTSQLLLSTGMNEDFVAWSTAWSYSSDGTDTVAASWSRLFSFVSSQPLRAQYGTQLFVEQMNEKKNAENTQHQRSSNRDQIYLSV